MDTRDEGRRAGCRIHHQPDQKQESSPACSARKGRRGGPGRSGTRSRPCIPRRFRKDEGRRRRGKGQDYESPAAYGTHPRSNTRRPGKPYISGKSFTNVSRASFRSSVKTSFRYTVIWTMCSNTISLPTKRISWSCTASGTSIFFNSIHSKPYYLMSDKLIFSAVILAAVLIVAVSFVYKALHYRRRMHSGNNTPHMPYASKASLPPSFPDSERYKAPISACGVRRSAAITGYGFVRNITNASARLQGLPAARFPSPLMWTGCLRRISRTTKLP